MSIRDFQKKIYIYIKRKLTWKLLFYWDNEKYWQSGKKFNLLHVDNMISLPLFSYLYLIFVMHHVCFPTLLLCLALSTFCSRVFLNFPSRYPRVPPSLDERIFSTQPVTAVYSVSRTLYSHSTLMLTSRTRDFWFFKFFRNEITLYNF